MEEKRLFWRVFKIDIAAFCERKKLGDFGQLPDLSREAPFVKEFEVERGGEELTVDEFDCFRERVELRWCELLSLRVNQGNVVEILSDESVEDEVQLVEDSVDEVQFVAETSKKRRQSSSPETSCSDLKKKRKEPEFEATSSHSATCPICHKHFDLEYIEEHSAYCADQQRGLVSAEDERQMIKDDLRNRRYTQRRKIDPITGKETLVKNESWSRGPFRANEEEIQRAQMEQFQFRINKSPQPVRTMYPHFDRPTEPIAKCPICAFTYLQRELEEHGVLCAARAFKR